MKRVLFATGNESKALRFKDELFKKGIEIITINDLDRKVDVIENGNNAIENALIKAKSYAKEVDIPVFAMDDNLYIENIPEDKQPGMYVRRVDGKRLTDEEMIDYYSKLVRNYSTDGKLTCKWIYGMVVINKGKESVYTWSKNDFYLVDKPTNKIDKDYPLNSISVNKKLNKYFTDMTNEDKKLAEEDESDVIDFIASNIV